MLIIALVLAAIGLAALVFAVVTSNALVAWVCIGASLLGVLLLIVDALRERRRQTAGAVEQVVVESLADSGEDIDDDVVGDDADDVSEVSDVVDAVDAADAAEPPIAEDDAADETAAHPAD